MNPKNVLLSIRHAAVLAVLAVESALLLTLVTASVATVPCGIGVLTTPGVLDLVRRRADHRRRLLEKWYGVRTPSPYPPEPPRHGTGVKRQWHRCWWLLEDPATQRDLQWLAFDSLVGAFLAWLSVAVLPKALYGFALAAGLWRPIYRAGGGDWYDFVHVTSQDRAWMAAGLGVVYLLLGLRYTPRIMALHTRLSRQLLSPTPARELRLRVARLAETRADAVDVSAAELRRIERDLHDGAQARLVAMGMSLGLIEHLLENDPAQARRLLAETRQSSSHALTELRELVRGIHPPVLAERGLGDAVRALALRSSIPAEITVEFTGRFPAPVEAAVYFAVSELLTNAAKHADAGRLWLDLRHDGGTGMLRVTVGDDGRGGADPAGGTGLRGVERRLGTFDGVLAVSSPAGGPTTVTMEVPCVSSSPKISSC